MDDNAKLFLKIAGGSILGVALGQAIGLSGAASVAIGVVCGLLVYVALRVR